MVIYLDAATNRKGKPNENFAREVMELFTLGEGHYAESDIREAARAFTGWSIDRDTGAFKWRPVFHDDGTKTVFGKSGNFDGDAVLALLLEQPRTAEFITGKLWREFVSTEPDSAEVKRIARQFFASNYEIKVALREIFRSRAFWAAENRAALIKSPVDLVVGTMRALDFSVGDPLPLALLVAQLGQNLFAPPNVKGWPGGEAWINSSSLLARKNFAERLFRADEMPKIAMSELKRGGAGNEVAAAGKAGSIGAAGRERFVRALFEIQFDPDRWLSQFPGAVSRADIQRALLPREPVSEIALDSPTREFVKRIALDPAYQLK
jgi:uncharacterized protein (DUF1800 family)